MSHTSHIEIEFKDLDCLALACKKLRYKYKRYGKYTFYNGATYDGFIVEIETWVCPIVIKGNSITCDLHNGSWGDIKDLKKLKAYYGAEKVKAMAKEKGYKFEETMVEDKPQIRIFLKG